MRIFTSIFVLLLLVSCGEKPKVDFEVDCDSQMLLSGHVAVIGGGLYARELAIVDLDAAKQIGSITVAGPAVHRCAVNQQDHSIWITVLGKGTYRIDPHTLTNERIKLPRTYAGEIRFVDGEAFGLMGGKVWALDLVGSRFEQILPPKPTLHIIGFGVKEEPVVVAGIAILEEDLSRGPAQRSPSAVLARDSINTRFISIDLKANDPTGITPTSIDTISFLDGNSLCVQTRSSFQKISLPPGLALSLGVIDGVHYVSRLERLQKSVFTSKTAIVGVSLRTGEVSNWEIEGTCYGGTVYDSRIYLLMGPEDIRGNNENPISIETLLVIDPSRQVVTGEIPLDGSAKVGSAIVH